MVQESNISGAVSPLSGRDSSTKFYFLKENTMKFIINEGIVNFEFTYGDFTINIIDYTTQKPSQPGYAHIRTKGEISVLIQKSYKDLCSEDIEKIARYIDQRIKGNAVALNTLINLNLQPGDEFMWHLLSSIFNLEMNLCGIR
jgi:hypothetical protein